MRKRDLTSDALERVAGKLAKIPPTAADGMQKRSGTVQQFWGTITGWALVSGHVLFSWAAQCLKNDGSFDDLGSPVAGSNTGKSVVLVDAVRMIQIGYDAAGKPVYGFERSPNFPARITVVDGDFPEWTYTIQKVIAFDASKTGPDRWVTDGVDLEAQNRCEWTPDGYPYTHGNGVQISDSSGTVGSSTCLIIPLGVGLVVDTAVDYAADGTTTYSFCEPNSSQDPDDVTSDDGGA